MRTLNLKHVNLECDNCFIGFEVPVVRYTVATTQESETNRPMTVDCWHGGGSSRSELDIYDHMCVVVVCIRIAVFTSDAGLTELDSPSKHL